METVKLETGTKVYVPKNQFKFEEELIAEYQIFQDEGEGSVLVVDKNGFIIHIKRDAIFTDIKVAKDQYILWLTAIAAKLQEAWKEEAANV